MVEVYLNVSLEISESVIGKKGFLVQINHEQNCARKSILLTLDK